MKKDPNEMSFADKAVFGLKMITQRPTFMRYGTKNAFSLLKRMFRDSDLVNAVVAKISIDQIYMGYAYRWGIVEKDNVHYPEGGMQAIPNATVAATQAHGGTVLLNTEVEQIIITDGKAQGVVCKNGRKYYADKIVSNSSPHFVVNHLASDCSELAGLRKNLAGRKPYMGGMINFLGVSGDYDFKGANYLAFTEKDYVSVPEVEWTPHSCLSS